MSDPQATPAEEPEAPQPVATVTVLFMPDGSMPTHIEGLRPGQAWAAAGLLRNIGDDLFAAQQAQQAQARMQAAREAEARRPKILTPTRR